MNLEGDRETERQKEGEAGRWEEAIRRIICEEWVTTLGDLVERRLMLLYDPALDRELLVGLARLLVSEGKLAEQVVEAAVDECATRLRLHFGLRI